MFLFARTLSLPSNNKQGKLEIKKGQKRDSHCHHWHHALGPLLSKFLLVVLQLVDTSLGCVWVELERVPSDLELPLSLRRQIRTLI